MEGTTLSLDVLALAAHSSQPTVLPAELTAFTCIKTRDMSLTGGIAVVMQTADEQGRRKAQERFQQLKTAYEVLRDPELRREYDSGRMAEAA